MSSATAQARPADKYDERRNQLAESALRTLGELGYARTSLREIASNSEFSHGVVHYYFDDKFELIVYCVRYYKARCVTRYDAVVADGRQPRRSGRRRSRPSWSRPPGRGADAPALVRPAHPEHVRGQPARRGHDDRQDAGGDDLAGRLRYAELAGRRPARTPQAAYGLLDGVFQQALFGHLTGRAGALDELVTAVRELMPYLLAP